MPLSENWLAELGTGVLPVLTLVVGFFLKEAGDRFGHRRATERERGGAP